MAYATVQLGEAGGLEGRQRRTWLVAYILDLHSST